MWQYGRHNEWLCKIKIFFFFHYIYWMRREGREMFWVVCNCLVSVCHRSFISWHDTPSPVIVENRLSQQWAKSKLKYNLEKKEHFRLIDLIRICRIVLWVFTQEIKMSLLFLCRKMGQSVSTITKSKLKVSLVCPMLVFVCVGIIFFC